jgi:hypothetical protein
MTNELRNEERESGPAMQKVSAVVDKGTGVVVFGRAVSNESRKKK